jgi:hypothetical protein
LPDGEKDFEVRLNTLKEPEFFHSSLKSERHTLNFQGWLVIITILVGLNAKTKHWK